MANDSRKRILIVDDEPKLVRLLKVNLESLGFEVSGVLNAKDGLAAVQMDPPDLILLDIALPDGDGFELCSTIREFSDVLIIMLTAKSREADKLLGFRCGADDYITKPFSTVELLARVQAVLKRRSPEQWDDEAQISCSDVLINLVQRRVFKGDREIRLTSTEYSLLRELALNSGKVLLHAELLSRVWGTEYQNELEYLRAYTRHLRRKIEDDPGNPVLIRSVPGVGYCLSTGQE
jgi:DNA-binding response OmpR family regulator